MTGRECYYVEIATVQLQSNTGNENPPPVAHTPAKSEVILRGHGSSTLAVLTTRTMPAFPFAVPREKAVAELSANASYFTGNKIITTWLHQRFPELVGPGLEPTRVQAVYFPAWIVDAVFKVSLTMKKQEDDAEVFKVRYLFL